LFVPYIENTFTEKKLQKSDFFKKKERRIRNKNLFATNNNGIKQEKQRNNTEVSS